MKISEFIAYLQTEKKKHGDIDVLCVTPGCAEAWEDAPPDDKVCSVYSKSKYTHDVETEKYLFIGIGG